ncbi:tripartite ATP-independent transporter DctP family solute receptor [Lacrimispora xylanisolvens]|uniref:Tripartite ATP-independent transporter DctP family solute receptor n=1 Tax=Lacrimispora xylanisolvens TaxID=384636 RepID=A0A2S6HV05_9FIRM|nr:TRAP transporter substrate-binding protein [Hungatella xylanolytica]PPK81669.1 tripartite ATP-independent transporter DctP family solute receptor [Hungatella xylanolytica]
MKKRGLSALLLAAIAALSLTACGGTAKTNTAAKGTTAAATTAAAGETTKGGESKEASSTDPQVTLVYAEVNPLDTIVGKTDQAFKDKVEELSGGSIKIDLQASGVLGAENDVLDNMLGGAGTIDMSRISAFALTSYGANKSKLLSIPYTFAGRDHYWKFVNSELAPEFLMEPHDIGLGVRGLFYGEEGFRHFFSKKPINSIDDVKGLKIRVSSDPVMTGMVSALGANATVVSMNELYSALQTGVVDAAEQPIANYKGNAFQEVAPNLILDGHTLGAIQVIITDSTWDKLTENQQKAMTEAAKYASEFNQKLSQDNEKEVLDGLKAAGVNVVEVNDITPWQEACKDVIAENTKDNAELYQKILDMK